MTLKHLKACSPQYKSNSDSELPNNFYDIVSKNTEISSHIIAIAQIFILYMLNFDNFSDHFSFKYILSSYNKILLISLCTFLSKIAILRLSWYGGKFKKQCCNRAVQD